MTRVILIPTDAKATECFEDSMKQEEAPLILTNKAYPARLIKEWMYAAQALVVYADSAPESNSDYWVDFAIKLGLKVVRRNLDGAAEDNQDPSGA